MRTPKKSSVPYSNDQYFHNTRRQWAARCMGMNPMRFPLLVILLSIGLLNTAQAETHENHFASVLVRGKKIGQVHFTTTHNDEGVLQELRTRSTYSILGVEVYHHTMDVHEFWKGGEIQTLRANADNDGERYQSSLRREPTDYVGKLNEKPIELPLEAFPVAVWHYGIVEHSLLFNLPDLKLFRVKVVKSQDSVTIGKQKIPAEKFTFSGDWKATIWFDHERRFLKWTYKVMGVKVTVLLDP